jgi:hypothetical protein
MVGLILMMCFVAFPGVFFSPTVIAAVSSVNVPLGHWSYNALDRLDGFGLIASDVHGTRPFTRMEIGRLVAEAVANREQRGEALPPLAEYLLQRLEREFAEEVATHTVGEGEPPKTFFKPIDEAEARHVFVEGEPRRFKGYPGSASGIDATEGTPLVYNNEGVVYGEHHNGSLQFSSSARLMNIFSAYIQPILLLRQDEGDFRNVSEGADADLLKGYAKISPFNLEVQAGRDSMWWGQGYHGTLLMTNNATPLDMIKVTNPSPTLLPWYFRYLGPFKYTFFLSRLEDQLVSPEDSPRELVTTDVGFVGWRFNFKPHPLFEFGVAATSIFGGEGRPSLGFADVFDLFGLQFSGEANRKFNQLAAIDSRLQLPFLWNAEVYGEFGGEDSGGTEFAEEFLFGDIGGLVGIYFPRITPDGKADFRVEYANNAHRVDSTPGFWYGHAIYRSGYTHDNMIMGHHMDGDAMDVFSRLTYYLRNDLLLGLDYDYMARGKTLSPVEEDVHEVGADVTFDFNDKLSIMTRYGYGSVENFDLIKDEDRTDHLLMTTVKYEF